MSSLFQQQNGPQPPREVTSPIEVLSILKGLFNQRSSLQIRFDERSTQFQTFIVHVDNQYVWLDELIPREGDRFMTQGESFRVDAWHDGVHIHWNAPAADCLDYDESPAYRLPLPSQLTYHQKRGAYRASMPPGIQAKLFLRHQKTRATLEGRVLDVSATGCQVTFEGDCSDQIKSGEEYTQSWLILPDGSRLDVILEARHLRFNENRDNSYVGMAFKKVDALTQRQIDRFVNFLQREARRLEKDDLF